MALLGNLGDEFVGQNQGAYDGVAHAAGLVATAFSGAAASTASTLKGGADNCLPEGFVGVTHELDAQTNTFSSTDIPGAPQDAARFNIYETNNGTSTGTVLGTLDVRCSGVPPAINIGVAVTVDGVVLLDILASNLSFGPGFFSGSVSGFLSTADGSDQISFGNPSNAFGGAFVSVSEDEFSSSVSRNIDFDIGDGILAQIEHNASSGEGFPPSEYGAIHVVDQNFSFDVEAVCQSFDFRVDLQNMGSGLQGPGIFCAPPPIADGYNYHVACFDGSFDDLNVSAADTACATNYFSGDATQVGQPVLDQIQRATDGLLGMSNAVFGGVQAGGEFAMALAESMQQQF